MNTQENKKACGEIAPLLVFFACGEVDDQERAAIEEHIAQCADCQRQLAEEQDFQTALATKDQPADELDPSGILLAQCRSELAEQLDDMGRPVVKEKSPSFGRLRWWMALHPAWSAALLVLFGLVGGIQFTQWFTGRNNAKAVDEAVNVRPSQRFTEDQLAKIAVAGVNFVPSATAGPQNVRVQLSAEQPVVLSGSLDDSDVREVLTYVVRNGERFDPGVRLDCLEALKARAEDLEVRGALLSAARKDQNPAVRMKALDALRNSASERDVRDTLLQALRHDSNPGVRVEAVNILVNSLESETPEALAPLATLVDPTMTSHTAPLTAANPTKSDASLENVVRALEDLQKSDPSRYVRLRSAAALRQINERNDQ
jgi:anti-sigma factor RsiW